MNNIVTIETEKQQRGQAFLQARRQLEQQYNCTVTIIPKWEPGVSGTFVLAFDEQVAIGPVPGGWKEETGETET